MGGDFTRDTFDPARHYTAVLRQQGRVDLDADFNEQARIVDDLQVRTRQDVIGPCGAPKRTDAFAVHRTDDGRLALVPGRFYVDGILCGLDAPELPVSAVASTVVTLPALGAGGRTVQAGDWVFVVADGETPRLAEVGNVATSTREVTLSIDVEDLDGRPGLALRFAGLYDDQPYLPGEPALTTPVAPRVDVVWLDVWERHVSAIQDPHIREVALGGPDTATRAQTVWQVRVAEGIAGTDCSDRSWAPPAPRGRMSARTDPSYVPEDPCETVIGGGFTGVENRLYRVEIHDGGALGSATFKWSRDNGSVAEPIDQFDATDPKQLTVASLGPDDRLRLGMGDHVEVLGDRTELHGDPGTFTTIAAEPEGTRLTLAHSVAARNGDGHERIVRWDGPLQTVSATEVLLEDGIRIAFSGGPFEPGEHWTFAARTAAGAIEPLTDAPPDGIVHHSCPLALVRWINASGQIVPQVEDCRPVFPDLTSICAEDVCYDDAACGMGDVETVQEAIDRLCARTDLPDHNKHLHGWGIVCGLKVTCAGEPEGQRRHVTVSPGYALECDGEDLRLSAAEQVDVLDLIDEVAGDLLDENGTGRVALIFERKTDGTAGFRVEAAEQWTAQDALKDTLAMAIWEDCLQVVRDLVERLQQPEFQDVPLILAGLLFASADRRFHAQRYISSSQHLALEDFYKQTLEGLSSPTFCALLDDLRPFPEYPGGPDAVTGKGLHDQLAVVGGRPLLASAGGDDKVGIWAGDELKQLAQAAFPGSGDAIVQDAILLADDVLVAAATISDRDSLVSLAKVDGDGNVEWVERSAVTCNARLVRLQPGFEDDTVLAIAPGEGVYEIDLGRAGGADLKWPFTAGFHLERAPGGKVAFATSGAQEGAEERYSGVVALSADDTGVQTVTDEITGRWGLAAFNDDGREGFVVSHDQGDTLHTLRFATLDSGPLNDLQDLPPEEVRLAWLPETREVIVAACDTGRILLGDPMGSALDTYEVPVPLRPRALAVSPETDSLFVLTGLRNTLVRFSLKELADRSVALPDPEQVESYGDAILNAYLDLLAAFVQHVKDCICQKLLIDCPTCDPEDVIYLGSVRIRDGQVRSICNLSRRRYVKSFPAWSWWLSAVPIWPFATRLLELVCCAALPDIVARADAAKTDEKVTLPDRASPRNAWRGAEMIHHTRRRDVDDKLSELFEEVGNPVRSFLQRRRGEAPERSVAAAPAPQPRQPCGQSGARTDEVAELRAEIERLRAEQERLQADVGALNALKEKAVKRLPFLR